MRDQRRVDLVSGHHPKHLRRCHVQMYPPDREIPRAERSTQRKGRKVWPVWRKPEPHRDFSSLITDGLSEPTLKNDRFARLRRHFSWGQGNVNAARSLATPFTVAVRPPIARGRPAITTTIGLFGAMEYPASPAGRFCGAMSPGSPLGSPPPGTRRRAGDLTERRQAARNAVPPARSKPPASLRLSTK